MAKLRALNTPDRHERIGDMDLEEKLILHRQRDGDIIVTVAGLDREGHYQERSVEFCTVPGGGRSQNTLRALHALFEAIEQDNTERPIT